MEGLEPRIFDRRPRRRRGRVGHRGDDGPVRRIEIDGRDRDNGGAIVNGGRMDAKTFYSVAASGTTGVLSNYVYSATNVRLRELSLSYTLPALARERLRITLSLIANNVLMLHNEAPFDPELTSNTGTYYQGFDYFMPPSLRSWGFGVKVNF